MFGDIYRHKNVFLTGHTGFKGSWLALWLSHLGANVFGYALAPPTEPSHFALIGLDMPSVTGDVRDGEALALALNKQKPDIIFHLAAQAIVRRSYREPLETVASNILGTANLLEAARACPSVRAIVIVTSDKCYENREWPWGYREIDRLGGYDPYSASKACAEILTRSWRDSFFNLRDYGKTHGVLVASARAGNVIGGGDWGADRLIPDIMRAVAQSRKVVIRNPRAVRPWQHVLEPLSGYLALGQKLLDGQKEFADAWNFGPADEGHLSVGDLVRKIKTIWPKIDYEIQQDPAAPHEAGLLRLDCSKARLTLPWTPAWSGQDAIGNTAGWYRMFYESGKIDSAGNLASYIKAARDKGLAWTKE